MEEATKCLFRTSLRSTHLTRNNFVSSAMQSHQQQYYNTAYKTVYQPTIYLQATAFNTVANLCLIIYIIKDKSYDSWQLNCSSRLIKSIWNTVCHYNVVQQITLLNYSYTAKRINRVNRLGKTFVTADARFVFLFADGYLHHNSQAQNITTGVECQKLTKTVCLIYDQKPIYQSELIYYRRPMRRCSIPEPPSPHTIGSGVHVNASFHIFT